eukprot:scaffold660775_cov93-Prasinocladus_malaysianus.AAC.1
MKSRGDSEVTDLLTLLYHFRLLEGNAAVLHTLLAPATAPPTDAEAADALGKAACPSSKLL